MVEGVSNKDLNKVIQQQSDNQIIKNNCLSCYALGKLRTQEPICKLEYKQKVVTYHILGSPFFIPCPVTKCPKPTSRFFYKKCKAANII
jgi:hypothetical protein